MVHPVITDCAGEALSEAERALFAQTQPFGFILFQRNCKSPAQLKALTAEMRASVNRDDVPILIDQEGGRVARLKPPVWRLPPAANVFANLAADDLLKAEAAARLNARLIGYELAELGINVDCLPLLDLVFGGAHQIIGDRSYGSDPEQVARLGRTTCLGLMDAGVLPVVKHIPGHGRASVDSHLALPVVEASLEELRAFDFKPFIALNDMAVAMTAHITYTAIDPKNPATTSAKLIDDIIRREIGFKGLLLSDDITMKALGGAPEERALASLRAGCDILLHCNGSLDERRRVLEATPDLDDREFARLRALMTPPQAKRNFDPGLALAELEQLLGPQSGGQGVSRNG